MSITLNIPNNIHKALQVSPSTAEKRLKLEYACENVLSRHKAAFKMVRK